MITASTDNPGDEQFWASLFPDLNRHGAFLQLQIRQAIVTAIEEGDLPLGTKMPSGRELAAILRVSRNTVVIAYEQLVDQDWLISRERRGYFVAGLRKPLVTDRRLSLSAIDADERWKKRYAFRPSIFRNIVKPLDWQNYPYPFIFGQFDPTLFPTNDWRESARAALTMGEIEKWARDMIDSDDPALVEQFQRQVLPRRGIRAKPEEIMMTMGAQHALYLIARLFVGPGVTVGMEDPGYPDARNIFGMMTSKIIPLPVDDGGLVIQESFQKCQLVYVTASQQCPTAVVMPMERREQLLEAAKTSNAILIEDDYGSELVPDDVGLPPLKSLDRHESVIYVGSLSKALAPGLRLGYIVAPAPVICELRALRRLMLRHPPLNNQRIAALFIGLGHYRSHLMQTTHVMADRAQMLDRLLPVHLPACTFTRGVGSTNYWVTCPHGVDTEILAEKARREGVLIEPGGVFSMDGKATGHCFRLGFSSIRTDRIEAGIQRLGKVLA